MAQQFSITEKGDIEMRYPPEPPQMNRLILFNFLLLELYQDELKSSLHVAHDIKASYLWCSSSLQSFLSQEM